MRWVGCTPDLRVVHPRPRSGSCTIVHCVGLHLPAIPPPRCVRLSRYPPHHGISCAGFEISPLAPVPHHIPLEGEVRGRGEEGDRDRYRVRDRERKRANTLQRSGQCFWSQTIEYECSPAVGFTEVPLQYVVIKKCAQHHTHTHAGRHHGVSGQHASKSSTNDNNEHTHTHTTQPCLRKLHTLTACTRIRLHHHTLNKAVAAYILHPYKSYRHSIRY